VGCDAGAVRVAYKETSSVKLSELRFQSPKIIISVTKQRLGLVEQDLEVNFQLFIYQEMVNDQQSHIFNQASFTFLFET